MSDSSVIHNSQPSQQPASNEATGRPSLASRPWLRFYEEGVPAELTIPDQPLTWLLDQTVNRYPGQTAII